MTTLNRQFTGQTERLLARFSLAIGALVLIGLSIGTWLDTHHEVDAISEILATRVEADFDSLGREAQSLATSPVLVSGLMRQDKKIAWQDPSTTALKNASGRLFCLFDADGEPVAAGVAPLVIPRTQLQRVLNSGTPAALALRGAEGEPTLAFLAPVLSPTSKRPVGGLVGRFDPLKSLVSGSWHPGPGDEIRMRLANAGDRADGGIAAQRHRWQTVRAQRTITGLEGIDGSRLTLSVDRPSQRILLTIVGGLTLLLSFLGLLRLQIRRWAHQTGKRITERLDQLSEVCLRIAAGERLLPAQDPTTDEIGVLARVLRAAMQAQIQLTDQLEPAALVLRNVQEGVVVTDDTGRITQVNPAFERMTGWQTDTLLGRPGGVIYRSMDNPHQAAEISEAVRHEGLWRGETRIICANGSALPVLLSIAAVHDSDGVRRGNVALVADISEARRISDRLRKMALTDPLTGLANHAGFEPQLRIALRGVSSDPNQPSPTRVALAFIDLDRLKFINDLFGHRVGDEAIRRVAKHLRAALPEGAVASRRSGDEFLLFVPFAGSHEAVSTLFTRLLDNLVLEDAQLPGGRLTLSLSIGAALCPDHASTTADLMVAADSALQQAKIRGRGRVAWYDVEIGRQMQARRRMENHLRNALNNRDIKVSYQPEIDLRTGAILGFEALARWHDPELGEVSPTDFIPIAEDAKLIDGVFDAVLQLVLSDLPRLTNRFAGIRIAINVSPCQLRDDRLAVLLAEHQRGLPNLGEILDLEVTETDFASDESGISATLRALAGLGIRIAIDDFGQGHSSLARLTSMPISRLKIDRIFVAGLDQGPQCAIVRAILGLAEATGLEVTAEGIERPQQLEILRALGCVRGQGWLFSPALPIDAVMQLPANLLNVSNPPKQPRTTPCLLPIPC